MAIVINGSGTLSGLAVGGLPDGTVDAGTVAADVATQAEIDAKLNLAGGTMTGNISMATNEIDWGDDGRARFGASQDLQIYHDSNRSWIQDVGTSSLIIDTDGPEVDINSGGNAKFMGRFIKDAEVSLYHNGTKKFETTATGASVTGTLVESVPTNAITSIVTPGNLGNINMGTSWATVNTTYYKWVLPSAGTYLVGGIFRSRQWTNNGFMKVRLYDNTNSTTISLSDRMMLESGNNANTLNAIGSPIWKHTCTGAVTLYLQGYSSSGGNSGIQEDSNGMNECWHVKLF
jgi:hypothetical protein